MNLALMEYEDTVIKFVLTVFSSNLGSDGTNSFNILPNVWNSFVRDNHKHMQTLADGYYETVRTPSPASTKINCWTRVFFCALTQMALPYYFEAKTRNYVISFTNTVVFLKENKSFKKHYHDIKYLPKRQ